MCLVRDMLVVSPYILNNPPLLTVKFHFLCGYSEYNPVRRKCEIV